MLDCHACVLCVFFVADVVTCGLDWRSIGMYIRVNFFSLHTINADVDVLK